MTGGATGDAATGGATAGTAPEPRTVLVTGGNRGIGLACARAFVSRGDRVAVTYRSGPPEEEGLLAVPCDVTSTKEVDVAFDQVEDELGKVQVLVANAGITDDKLFLRMDDESWDRVLDTNLNGAYRVARRAAGPMVRARGGRMVFISSVVAYLGAPGQANYGAAKAGLTGLARSLARELGSRGITCNVVAPGPVATDMLLGMGQERVDQLASLAPLRRVAQPEEVAAAVAFLASAEAGYITGAVVPVDGGMSMGI